MSTSNKITEKESYLGRSPRGQAVVSFENQAMLTAWIEKNPSHRLTFYKQVITEEEIKLET